MAKALDKATIRVGVLGATGFIGTPYRDEIRASRGAKIVALCARRKDMLDKAGRIDGASLMTTNWREVVDHPDVNLVVVATPDALHHEAVVACAAARKHLVCEKPVGANAHQAREMWNAYSKRNSLAHFVPFWTRYFPLFARAKTMVADNTLGSVKVVIYRWHNPRPSNMPFTWRDNPELSAGGSIADVGSHAYDTVRWILGQEAERVLAHADTITAGKADLGEINLAEALDWGQSQSREETQRRRGGTADYAAVAWEFSGGIIGVLVLSHASFLRKGLAPELEIHGTEGSLGVDRVRGQLTLAPNNSPPEVIATLPSEGLGNRFEQFVFPVVRDIMDGNTPADHPDLRDGWRCQLFTDAVACSAERGCWVELKEIAAA